MKSPVYFDLDGTLTDPKTGITECVRYALKKLGVQAPPAEDLTWCIGPPLRESFDRLVGPERSTDAIAAYRERFSDVGWAENEVYPDIPFVLARLRELDVPLYVATSKPHEYANRILDHFELSQFFGHVFGAEMNGELSAKPELLRYAMNQVGASRATMIGDRKHDAIGALANDMTMIGVTYGYGSQAELEEAGAHHIVDAPITLLGLLGERGEPI